MMNNPFSALIFNMKARRRARQFEKMQAFLDTYYQCHAWTLMKCPMCERPATAPDAHFCAFCGASMTPTSSKLHPLLTQERNTAPLQKRPMLAYLEMKDQMEQRNTGPHTNYHRAVHLKKVTHP